MLSAGGFAVPIISWDLQCMVREPISPEAAISGLMHGLIKSDQSMDAAWFSKEGLIYVDCSHVFIVSKMGIPLKYLQRPQFCKLSCLLVYRTGKSESEPPNNNSPQTADILQFYFLSFQLLYTSTWSYIKVIKNILVIKIYIFGLMEAG
ncbi:hypothetical protein REPUB_Repub05bG0081800 [Reevesia pubescens]